MITTMQINGNTWNIMDPLINKIKTLLKNDKSKIVNYNLQVIAMNTREKLSVSSTIFKLNVFTEIKKGKNNDC